MRPPLNDYVLAQIAGDDRRIRAGLQQEQVDRELAADDQAQAAALQERMFRAAHMGISQGDWAALAQARTDAMAGIDRSAPRGTEQNPCVLVDGQDVSQPTAPGNTARSQADRDLDRYYAHRHDVERDPVLSRMFADYRRREIYRAGMADVPGLREEVADLGEYDADWARFLNNSIAEHEHQVTARALAGQPVRSPFARMSPPPGHLVRDVTQYAHVGDY